MSTRSSENSTAMGWPLLSAASMLNVTLFAGLRRGSIGCERNLQGLRDRLHIDRQQAHFVIAQLVRLVLALDQHDGHIHIRREIRRDRQFVNLRAAGDLDQLIPARCRRARWRPAPSARPGTATGSGCARSRRARTTTCPQISEMRSLFSRCHETYSSPVTHCHTAARTSRPPLSVAFAMILYEPACGGVYVMLASPLSLVAAVVL